ncbi:TPM domain-containing protein [Dongia sp.]|uniref:TPM domain-containing protein n=1 Tax=Dongia sp. TaxID=1977262 RepID=UPI0037511251
MAWQQIAGLVLLTLIVVVCLWPRGRKSGDNEPGSMTARAAAATAAAVSTAPAARWAVPALQRIGATRMAGRMRADMIEKPAALRALRQGILAGLVLAVALIGTAQALSTPERSGWVTDQAGILDPQLESDLARRLMELKRRTGAEVIVVTLQSLQGASIETWGDMLGESWNVGRAEGKDYGALLIVAPNDRKVRIAVGYGLGYRLSDSDAVSIIQDRILPYFRRGDFAGGVDDGVTAIFERVDRRAAIEPPALDNPAVERSTASDLPEIEQSSPAAPPPAKLRRESDTTLSTISTGAVVVLIGCGFILLFLHRTSRIDVAVSSPPRQRDEAGSAAAADTAVDKLVAATQAATPPTNTDDETLGDIIFRILTSNAGNGSSWGNRRSGWEPTSWTSSSSRGSSWVRPSSSSSSFGGFSSSSHSSSSSSSRSFGGSSSGGSRRSFGGGASGSW